MVVADDLAPIWRQGICNNHDDMRSVMTKVSQRDEMSGRSTTHWFLLLLSGSFSQGDNARLTLHQICIRYPANHYLSGAYISSYKDIYNLYLSIDLEAFGGRGDA